MTPTPGPWKACNGGECSCFIVSGADYPVAKVVCGKWGDDYPALRLVGPTSLEQKVEAYMEQITYGEIDPAEAKANALLIAAAPRMREALVRIRNGVLGLASAGIVGHAATIAICEEALAGLENEGLKPNSIGTGL